MKMIEENIDVNLHDFGLGNGFWDMTQKAQATNRKKVDILKIIKIKSCCASKDTTKKVKRQST